MVVQLSDITKTYKSGSLSVDALRGISLDVEEGDFTTIMGSSGSGKSTLMNIIGCLDKPTSGRYLLKGEDVSGFNREKLAQVRNRTIGFVFQNFHLLPRTSALENVELPLLYSEDKVSWKEIHKRAEHALEITGLADRAKHTPNELSGGQQQRVAIARALVTKPSVLLADEPTGNLDEATAGEVLELLLELVRQTGGTLLMVTHSPQVAAPLDRCLVLSRGRLADRDASRNHTEAGA